MVNNYRGCVYENPSRRISSGAQMSTALLEHIHSGVIYCCRCEIMIGYTAFGRLSVESVQMQNCCFVSNRGCRKELPKAMEIEFFDFIVVSFNFQGKFYNSTFATGQIRFLVFLKIKFYYSVISYLINLITYFTIVSITINQHQTCAFLHMWNSFSCG